VRRGNAGGEVFQVDPVTYAVAPFGTTGGAAIPATMNGPYNKFLYVPRLGGCVYVPTYRGNAWFLKTCGAGPGGLGDLSFSVRCACSGGGGALAALAALLTWRGRRKKSRA
jgi:hypothetical protein